MSPPSYLQRIARQFGDHAPVLLPVRPLFGRGLTDRLPPVTGGGVAGESDQRPAVAPVFPSRAPAAQRFRAIEPDEQPAVALVRQEPEPEFPLFTKTRPVIPQAGVSYDAPVETAIPDGRFAEESAVSPGRPPRVSSELLLESKPAPPTRQTVSAPAETEVVARQTPSPPQRIQRTAEFETTAAVQPVQFYPAGETLEQRRPPVENMESNGRPIAPLQPADREVFAERVSSLPGIEPAPPALETTVTVPPAPVSPVREPLEAQPSPLPPRQASVHTASPAEAQPLHSVPPARISPDSAPSAAPISAVGEPLPAHRRPPSPVELNPPAQSSPPHDSGPETRYRVTLEPKPPGALTATIRTPWPLSSPPTVHQPERSPEATVQIGSLDIHITPATQPPPAPMARPSAPVGPLARGFTSPFGLRQG